MLFPWEEPFVKSVVDYFDCMVLECEPLKEDIKREQKMEE